jgi:hypothetical protein
MNRTRRPFPISRRDTDSVQLNTLDPQKSAQISDIKGPEIDIGADSDDIEHGHLKEIEVDIDAVLHDGQVKDIDEDTSPYPEGIIRRHASSVSILTYFDSSSRSPRDG